jgi:tRNA (guanine10-N2)-methyltransferase
VGDPPYGVRAGGRKSHARPDIEVRDRSRHFASTAPYGLTECVDDLADMAARLLAPGGCGGFGGEGAAMAGEAARWLDGPLPWAPPVAPCRPSYLPPPSA